jgi:hypothetical protein
MNEKISSIKTNGITLQDVVMPTNDIISNPNNIVEELQVAIEEREKEEKEDLLKSQSGDKITFFLDSTEFVVSSKIENSNLSNDNTYDFGTISYIKDDTTMVSARFLANALGADVNYDNGIITITKDDIVITLTIGSDVAYVNGEEYALTNPVSVEEERSYVPARFLANALGASIEFDQKNNSVSIYKNSSVSIEDYANYQEKISKDKITKEIKSILGVNSDDVFSEALEEILAKYDSNLLIKLSDSDSLYNYCSKETLEQVLEDVQTVYSGREAAVDSVISLLKISVDSEISKSSGDAYVKLDYDWGDGHHGGEVTLDDIASGVDCSAFVSWAINQGSTETFDSQTTAGLMEIGTNISYSNLQSGDYVVKRSNGNGHTMFILDNDGSYVTIAEAASANSGVRVRKVSYDELSSNGYIAKDISSYYE